VLSRRLTSGCWNMPGSLLDTLRLFTDRRLLD
jgi:hypothetical protein